MVSKLTRTPNAQPIRRPYSKGAAIHPQNPAEDLSLDRLAGIAAMSRFHWHRVFHAMTGETCAQAVRQLRLFRAAGWLVRTDKTIAQIAADVGYPNVNSFIRAFRDGVGMSPSEFQTRGHLGPPPEMIGKRIFKMFDVKVVQTPDRRLAALSHKGAHTSIGQSFEKLFAMASKGNVWPITAGVIGVYYDDPNTTAAVDLRSHAGLVLAGDAIAPDGFEAVIIFGGDHAVLRYKGPYHTITVGYDHLFGKWLPNSGLEPADAPCYELYLNNPEDTAPEDLLTEIYLPLVSVEGAPAH